MQRSRRVTGVALAYAVALTGGFGANAQAPAPVAAPETAAPARPAAAPTGLDQLAWLRGCWAGNVNRRDFAEQWLPPRAGMMVGVSHSIVQDRRQASESRTQDYTYLRLEARADGVYYVAIPSGKKEMPFKLTGVENDKGTQVFTFTGSGDAFPQRIVYRRTEGGLLFAQVAGKIDGQDKEVTYPMRHVDCMSGQAARE
jgi:hypothetical protein